MNERPIRFDCCGTPLVGMLHGSMGNPEIGVLVIVAGGPQYRIGGARQLVLWARKFSAQGFPVLRFDFRGMGDSYGSYLGFENVEEDLKAALEALFAEVPSLRRVVLWGECNACSASLFYAYKDPRVAGIVMLNPWVRTEEGEAKTMIKRYYLQRLMQRSFWAKVFRFEFDVVGSIRSALGMVRLAARAGKVHGDDSRTIDDGAPGKGSLPGRMLHGLSRFKGRMMLVMSGRDYAANEFDELLKSSAEWRQQLAAHNTVRHDLEFADHTFSTAAWRDQVAEWGSEWLVQLAAESAAADNRDQGHARLSARGV